MLTFLIILSQDPYRRTQVRPPKTPCKPDTSKMSSIQERLVRANIERDNMLAALADDKMYKEATQPGAPAYAVERWNKRAARRALERACRLQHSIPPGPWDDDLDNYPGSEYVVDIGDGYEAVLNRDRYWMWRIYVRIPADHPFVGKHYDNLFINVTYSEGNMFGFYLRESYTSSPYYIYSTYDSAETFNPMFPQRYVNYERALEMAKELKEKFQAARLNPAEYLVNAEEVEEENNEGDAPPAEAPPAAAPPAAAPAPKKPASYKAALLGNR